MRAAFTGYAFTCPYFLPSNSSLRTLGTICSGDITAQSFTVVLGSAGERQRLFCSFRRGCAFAGRNGSRFSYATPFLLPATAHLPSADENFAILADLVI